MIRITEENIKQFAELSGDHNPIHIDQEYAKTTAFKRRIAHGALIISYVSQEIAKQFNNPIIKDITFTFIKPAYIGDKIRIRLTDDWSSGNRKWVHVSVKNQNKEEIITGNACIIVRRYNE